MLMGQWPARRSASRPFDLWHPRRKAGHYLMRVHRQQASLECNECPFTADHFGAADAWFWPDSGPCRADRSQHPERGVSVRHLSVLGCIDSSAVVSQSRRASPKLCGPGPHFATLVINLRLLAKIAYRPNPNRKLSCVSAAPGKWILDWEVVAIILLLGGAAIGGIAYLLSEYRGMRDLDDWS